MSELKVNVEVSARHVHLSQADVEKLFGEGYELKVKKDIARVMTVMAEKNAKNA